jgi:serine/threonine-protein kinase
MNTPRPKFFCPRCKTAYDADMNYCGRCGADMHRASSLVYRRDESDPSWSHADGRTARARSARDDDVWIGRVVDSRYRVIERIGHGGMGVVYKIEHQRMGKIAAMKVLHRDLTSDAEVARRFRQEAQAVSRLTHPNTVQVFDFGLADGALYLVMEYVRGQDLGTLVKSEGPLPFKRAARLFHQICSALSEAHALGVIHRDLKPENILVTGTRDGHDFAKVLDFGLAKLAEREDLAEITDSGSIVGTPYYMSPEQIRGENIDARSDIYSLGALMYRVLTGEPPFRAQSPVGVLTKHLTAELVPPSTRRPELGIDPKLDALIDRAMRKRREERYAAVDELRADIERRYADTTGETGLDGMPPAGAQLRRGAGGAAARGRPSAGYTPGRMLADVDFGIAPDQRLNRADLAAFERSLRRERVLRMVGLPLGVLAVVAAGGYYLARRGDAPKTLESEPNNTLAQATLVAADRPVRGRIAHRLSPTESDKDVYRLVGRPRADGSQMVSVHVSALPNIDLLLHLYDASGKFLTKADARGVGVAESIRRYRVTGPVVVAISESPTRAAGALPTENVSDWYALTVMLQDVGPGAEVEPNDMDSDATPIQLRTPITGHLDERGDVDSFRFEGHAGTYDVSVAGGGAGGAALRRVGLRGIAGGRRATLELGPGDVISVARPDAATQPGAAAGTAPGPAMPTTVGASVPAAAALPGAEEDAYVIEIAPASARQ